MNKLIFLLPLFTTAITLGCTGGSSSNSNSFPSNSPATGATTTTPPAAPTVTPAAPLAVSVYTVYDTTKAVENMTFNETASTTCGVSNSDLVQTCTVVIPEGRLYFGSLNIKFSWTTATCKLLTFQPYYYMASTSATYLPPGATSTVDCSGASGPPGTTCYGGAAPQVVAGFPTKRSLIYLPDESVALGAESQTITVPSAFSLNAGSNRVTVNDMTADPTKNYTPAEIGAPTGQADPGDGYVANTYVNYQFECRDDWFDPQPGTVVPPSALNQAYTINLNIRHQSDNPSGTPVQNEDDFYSWAELVP